mmetsp:Transcript_11509/g.18877  ORF Transcript_11509/g.18877 Transcript_11509/m.18877 type:complete len:119 (+) Transcript_11509:155-511(+)
MSNTFDASFATFSAGKGARAGAAVDPSASMEIEVEQVVVELDGYESLSSLSADTVNAAADCTGSATFPGTGISAPAVAPAVAPASSAAEVTERWQFAAGGTIAGESRQQYFCSGVCTS